MIHSLAPLVLGSAVIALSGLIAAWVTGILVLTNVDTDLGFFTMDPLAWFNPMGTSSILPSWTTGWGQYEGYQYLGLGGFLLVLAGAVESWRCGEAKMQGAWDMRRCGSRQRLLSGICGVVLTDDAAEAFNEVTDRLAARSRPPLRFE